MPTTASIPRFLLPRGTSSSHILPLSRRLKGRPSTLARNASTQPSKPLVLEKPARFNPPSHPSRIRPPPRQYPGPPLSEAERQAQKTKQYPNMMPPEGTFLHWFLTNKMLHTWITMSTLFSLALFTFVTNFRRTTPYADMLPPTALIYSHPIQFLSQYIEVYKMHTAYVSAQTAELRRRKVEDVQKRAEYRKAHGLNDEEGWGGWTAKADGEVLGPALKTGDSEADRNSGVGAEAQTGEAAGQSGVYADFEGRKRPVKKWLGIW